MACPHNSREVEQYNNKTLLISCIFGDHFKSVHRAVSEYECVMFSNNEDLKYEAQSKGWRFELVKSHDLSLDSRLSSMQAKYVKFVQFFDEFEEYRNVERIIYFDHKLHILKQHVDFINLIFADEKCILIRNTPRLKLSIQDEINDARGQERYETGMERTVKWMNEQILRRKLTINNRVMHTGLIAYKNLGTIMPLLREIYDTVWRLGQPECQILFGLLSQEYENYIQRIDARELYILRELPE